MPFFFSNWWLLAFLPLAALPILLHLITLYRLRTVELSTFRFLMDSYVQQRRRVKLLEYLLMILRTLFVILVIAAISRPVVDHLPFLSQSGGGEVVIILDRGPAMELRSDGSSSMERARAAAGTLIERLSPNDRVTVLAAGAEPEVKVNRFATQRDLILASLDDIEPAAALGDLPAALRETLNLKGDVAKTIYLISDGHRATWSKLRDHPVLDRLTARDRIVMMDVGPSEPPPNVAVVGEPPSAGRAVRDLPLLLEATVVNTAGDATVDTVLSVVLQDKQVRRVNLTLEPGERKRVPIALTPSEAGVLRGRFELPGDAFPRDDSFLFCINVEPNLEVLLVSEPGGRDRADDPATYIRAALDAPLLAAADAPTEQQQLAAAIRVEQIRPNQLNANRLRDPHVVILADASLDQNRASMLRDYVERGGGLLVVPGPAVNPDVYNAHLLGSDDEGDFALLPPRGDPEDESSFAAISDVMVAHPVLEAFDDAEADYFATARLYRYFPLRSAAADDETSALATDVLARLTDGTPVLAERRVGQGRILIASFPATPQWSNLPLKPEFVPVMLRSVAHLQRPAHATAPAAVRPHEPAVIRTTDHWPDAQLQIRNPAGVPETIKLHRSGPAMVAAYPHTDAKGYYEAELLPREDDLPDRIELGFAVNLDPRHAEFQWIDPDEATGLFGPEQAVTYLAGGSDDPEFRAQFAEQREIWRHMIWATFLVIGLEFLLATLRPARNTSPAGSDDALADRHRAPLRQRLGNLIQSAGFADPRSRQRTAAGDDRGGDTE